MQVLEMCNLDPTSVRHLGVKERFNSERGIIRKGH